MRKLCAMTLVVFLSGAVVRSGAESEKGQASTSGSNRITWVVKAVRKTKESIVTLKVTKKTSRKETVGTGVIVDERGYIVTNRHVVNGGIEVKVVLSDNSSYSAEVDFEDGANDLAVVKISAPRKLRALPLGPATDLMPGEPVVAIGHPFGYVNTVSTGIVSALDREIEMPNGITLKNLIQTTAPINPGNSGGPLLNADGELIGINVALRSDAQNIAFALNADTVQQVLSRRLSASRKLGVYHGLDVREKVVEEGVDRAKAIVHEVADNTPAAAAGLKEGDQIVRLGEVRVTNRFDVERSLWDVRTGDTVEVMVVRSGREVRIPMKLDRETRTASR
jgi:serine protease Do